MKLFSFFKKPKETIEIKIPDVPLKKVTNEASDNDIYFERSEFVENKHNLEGCSSTKEKQSRLTEATFNFERKSNAMYHKYNFLKLFSKAADKDNKYNEMLLILDKNINRIKKLYEELKKKTDILKYIDNPYPDELENAYSKLNELFDFYRDIDKILNEFQNKYYKHLKMASFSICNEKTHQELESINKNINKIFEEYKTINEAYDYIFYNSGSLIVDTINALIECLKNSKNKELIKEYNYSYFLDSDFVVALNFSEWVELFTKIKYVIRTSNKVELFDYLRFKELYQELEKRYILMLIYNEMVKK